MMSNPSDGWSARAAALEILREQRVAVIATSEGDHPWASTVYYADDGFTLYVNTPTATTMLHNILANPRVGYAIDERRPTFFLQASGVASVVDDPTEFAHAKALLAQKVPEAHVGHPNYTLVRIASTVVYVSDFRSGYRPRARVDVGGELV
jgi:general stress protein 26